MPGEIDSDYGEDINAGDGVFGPSETDNLDYSGPGDGDGPGLETLPIPGGGALRRGYLSCRQARRRAAGPDLIEQIMDFRACSVVLIRQFRMAAQQCVA